MQSCGPAIAAAATSEASGFATAHGMLAGGQSGKLCLHWQSYRCNYGDRCHFRHDGPGGAGPGMPHNIAARLGHPGGPPASSGGASSKQQPCLLWSRYQCTYGDRCQFSHSGQGGLLGSTPGVAWPPGGFPGMATGLGMMQHSMTSMPSIPPSGNGAACGRDAAFVQALAAAGATQEELAALGVSLQDLQRALQAISGAPATVGSMVAPPPPLALPAILGPVVEVELNVSQSPKLGIDVKEIDNVMIVKMIGPGPVQDWNALNPDKTINIDDNITHVNGGPVQRGMRLMAQAVNGQLTLRVQKTPQQSASAASAQHWAQQPAGDAQIVAALEALAQAAGTATELSPQEQLQAEATAHAMAVQTQQATQAAFAAAGFPSETLHMLGLAQQGSFGFGGEQVSAMLSASSDPAMAALFAAQMANGEVNPALAAALAAGARPHKGHGKGRALCKHFLVGKCSFGEQCRFSHDTTAPGSGVSPRGVYPGLLNGDFASRTAAVSNWDLSRSAASRLNPY